MAPPRLAVEAGDRRATFFSAGVRPQVARKRFTAFAGIQNTHTVFIGMQHAAGQ